MWQLSKALRNRNYSRPLRGAANRAESGALPLDWVRIPKEHAAYSLLETGQPTKICYWYFRSCGAWQDYNLLMLMAGITLDASVLSDMHLW